MNCYCNRKIIMSSSPNHCVKSFQPQKMGKQTGIQDVQSFTVYHKKRGFDRHTHTSNYKHAVKTQTVDSVDCIVMQPTIHNQFGDA